MKELEVLLQKYYDGISSAEEELTLIEYFEQHDVPASWNAAKEQLLGMEAIKALDIEVPVDLDESILNSLANVQESKPRMLTVKRRTLFTAVSAAASIVILVSAILFLNRQPNLGTFDDPEIAYAETKDAFNLISKYFDQGTQELNQLSKMEDAVKPLSNLSKVEETRKNLQYLGELDKGLDQAARVFNSKNKK